MSQFFNWAMAHPPGERSLACSTLARFFHHDLLRPVRGKNTNSDKLTYP